MFYSAVFSLVYSGKLQVIAIPTDDIYIYSWFSVSGTTIFSGNISTMKKKLWELQNQLDNYNNMENKNKTPLANNDTTSTSYKQNPTNNTYSHKTLNINLVWRLRVDWYISWMALGAFYIKHPLRIYCTISHGLINKYYGDFRAP